VKDEAPVPWYAVKAVLGKIGLWDDRLEKGSEDGETAELLAISPLPVDILEWLELT
jgi:hypothetical protein